ncbi:MAG: glycosyltransferase family 1 protein, partial [Paludibacteraceae bacterium]|nr:glycosyltransferase family 1 protein [Paludibacteraceae bacterium]
MSTYLINCSNLKRGGALQVADSICSQLNRYAEHQFVVVLSDALYNTGRRIAGYPNVEIHTHTIRN